MVREGPLNRTVPPVSVVTCRNTREEQRTATCAGDSQRAVVCGEDCVSKISLSPK